MAATIAASHHERWDGTGYPLGLAGEAIPIEGRIVAVVDVLDALCSRRPYKEPYFFEPSVQILEQGRGRHFDPLVLDAFQSRKSQIEQILNEFKDS
jgi:putative two-component system response regulator